MRAAVAVAHKILLAVWHMLSKRKGYAELGAEYLDGLERTKTVQRLAARIEALGFAVTVGPPAA
jgi:hypothetical protein